MLIFFTRKKNILTTGGDGYCGDCLIIYTNNESLYHTSESHMMSYATFVAIKINKGKPVRWGMSHGSE